MIVLVAAMDENGLIGKDNRLPWHCPDDLRHFHELTRHHHLLLGRTTYEGLRSPFADRILHVATHTSLKETEHIRICHDVDTFLQDWKTCDKILYVCGGASIYAQAFPFADEYWLSRINGIYEGDTYMPDVDISVFHEERCEQRIGFTLYHYKRS